LVKDARAYGIKAMVADLEDYDLERLETLSAEVDGAIAVFCLATYGEGDPTDNAAEFWNLLKDRDESDSAMDLDGLTFAVFGLGNKTYEYYNTVAKYVDSMLEKFGGKRLGDLGLGDDDANLEEDYVNWVESFWTETCEHLNIDPESLDMSDQRQYELVAAPDVATDRVFTGEPELLGSFKRQKKHFTPKNPFLATVAVKQELYSGTDRSCLHIELDTTGSDIRYTAGDHVAIYPVNNAAIVEALGARLGIELDEVFSMKATDDDAKKQSPFPCPTTYRTALLHYMDITSLPKAHILKEFATHTSNPSQQKKLQLMGSKEGKKEYGLTVIRDHRPLLQLLEHFPTCNPPIDLLLELLPRLQPRYYSISSSSKLNPHSIHITAAVVEFQTKIGVEMGGVCTTWLDGMTAGVDKVPIFMRSSSFRLPSKLSTPVVMVGPGTGLAPFRGFIQEREWLRTNGKKAQTPGETILFFGAQKAAENFLYEDELTAWAEQDYATLHTAFSRDQKEKVYVQHQLEENGANVYNILSGGGHLYVCGDAKYMARDVNQALIRIGITEGNLTQQGSVNWLKDLRLRKRYSEDVW
jgi:NADPH-ferrihemoprotein reductase